MPSKQVLNKPDGATFVSLSQLRLLNYDLFFDSFRRPTPKDTLFKSLTPLNELELKDPSFSRTST